MMDFLLLLLLLLLRLLLSCCIGRGVPDCLVLPRPTLHVGIPL